MKITVFICLEIFMKTESIESPFVYLRVGGDAALCER